MKHKLLLFFTILFLSASWAIAQDSGISDGYVGENNDLNKSLDLKKVVEFYPNPAVDFLNIDIKDSELVQIEFEVYDIIGNAIKIAPEKLTKNKYRVPVGDLHAGYYMLIIKDPYSRYRQIFKFGKR